MNTKLALSEYANMMRVGSNALKGVLRTQLPNPDQDVESTLNEVLFMLDRFEELAEKLDGVEVKPEVRDRQA